MLERPSPLVKDNELLRRLEIATRRTSSKIKKRREKINSLRRRNLECNDCGKRSISCSKATAKANKMVPKVANKIVTDEAKDKIDRQVALPKAAAKAPRMAGSSLQKNSGLRSMSSLAVPKGCASSTIALAIASLVALVTRNTNVLSAEETTPTSRSIDGEEKRQRLGSELEVIKMMILMIVDLHCLGGDIDMTVFSILLPLLVVGMICLTSRLPDHQVGKHFWKFSQAQPILLSSSKMQGGSACPQSML